MQVNILTAGLALYTAVKGTAGQITLRESAMISSLSDRLEMLKEE